MTSDKKNNDLSWGRLPWRQKQISHFSWLQDTLPETEDTLLPYGRGRSYGDSCINESGSLVNISGLNHFIQFDSDTGLLRCEAGVTLEQILHLAVPRGWFLPATPGTKFVTVGGAIGNDVHGKNHHWAGTFGCHVKAFELLRSNGERLLCSPTENRELFCATIGGLGLTGLILWAEIQLKKIKGPLISIRSVRYRNLEEFNELAKEAADNYEYTVAWIDSQARGKNLAKGQFIMGDHASQPLEETPIIPASRKLTVPFAFPNFSLNPLTIRAFNWLYYWRQPQREVCGWQHYDPFFYPLDAINNWNRIYGNRGFFQYQCVVPNEDSSVIKEVIDEIAKEKSGSFLTVLKEFGDIQSPGMLSFPKKGVTFALDFPNNGSATRRFLDRLDDIVMASGGRVYPAKDARMSEKAFKAYYPEWETFQQYVDPKFCSNFWRRVTGQSS